MTQNKLFRLRVPDPNAWELVAKAVTPPNIQEMPCGQHRLLRRPGEFALEVKHNRHEEPLIGTLLSDILIHSRLAAEFERRGFTGYRLKPATVRFRDGSVSTAYSQLVETGWAGVARPESGVGSCGNAHSAHAKNTAHFVTPINWWTGISGAAMISWFFGPLDGA